MSTKTPSSTKAATHPHADPNVLSAEEEAALKVFRARIAESKHRGPGVSAMYSDLELSKFIVVAKADPEKAYRRFKNFHKLRLKHKFDATDHASLVRCARQCGAFIGVGGRDAAGRAMICVRGAGIDPDSIDTSGMMAMLVRVLGKVTPDLASTRRGVVFVMDMNGFGWSNFSLSLEKELSGLYQEGYPVRLAAMVMVSAPWWISALMKIMRTFLKKKLMDRIVERSDSCEDPDDPQSLYKMCPRKQLHGLIGGDITATLAQFVASSGGGGGGGGAAAAERT